MVRVAWRRRAVDSALLRRVRTSPRLAADRSTSWRSALTPSGRLIAAGRCLLGLTAAEFARLARMSPDSVKRAESGGAVAIRRRIAAVLEEYGITWSRNGVLCQPSVRVMKRVIRRCRLTEMDRARLALSGQIPIEALTEAEQDTLFDLMVAALRSPSPDVRLRYAEIGRQTASALASVNRKKCAVNQDQNPPSTWEKTEAKRWAALRKKWLRTYRTFTAAELAAMASDTSRSASALVKKWQDENRIFAVQQGHRRLYPAFQIGADGQPEEVFRKLIEILGGKLSGWALALWLTSPNSQLAHWAKPLDVIDRAPDDVLAAAAHEAIDESF